LLLFFFPLFLLIFLFIHTVLWYDMVHLIFSITAGEYWDIPVEASSTGAVMHHMYVCVQ